MQERITVNGIPSNIVVYYQTEPGEGWVGVQYVGTYTSLEDLNLDLPAIIAETPDYWTILIRWGDAE